MHGAAPAAMPGAGAARGTTPALATTASDTQGTTPAVATTACDGQGTTPALATTACVDVCMQWGDVGWIPGGDALGATPLELWSRQVSPVTALTVELETYGSLHTTEQTLYVILQLRPRCNAALAA